MTLAERLSEFVRACFTGIWITTLSPTMLSPRSPGFAATTIGRRRAGTLIAE